MFAAEFWISCSWIFLYFLIFESSWWVNFNSYIYTILSLSVYMRLSLNNLWVWEFYKLCKFWNQSIIHLLNFFPLNIHDSTSCSFLQNSWFLWVFSLSLILYIYPFQFSDHIVVLFFILWDGYVLNCVIWVFWNNPF